MTVNLPFVWTPSVGPKAGNAFTLPPFLNEFKPVAHHNRLQNIQQDSEMMSGVILSSGANPTFPSYGEIQATLIVSYAVLSVLGYSQNYAGLHTLHYDIAQYLMEGGLGTFTETLPASTLAGLGGASITSRSCTCVVTGDYTPLYDVVPKSEITVTFMNPKCRWTYSNGVTRAWI